MSDAVSTPTIPPGELAELMSAFNDAADRLEQTNQALNQKVERLTRELREANDQLERSRRLAALGQMAAGIAHEVRNPLGSIRLYAKMLDDDLGDRPEQRDTARKIARAVSGLDAIVGDVLLFSREIKLARGCVLIDDAVTRALETVRAGGLGEGVRVVREETGAEIEGDARLIEQALVNIVRNAFDAMRDAGGDGHELDIRIERGEQGMCAITVTDTGDGIDDEQIERVFNPFYTTRASGTGLGLPIVHRIAEAHGGRVEISRADRRGTSVALVLPEWRETAGEVVVRRRMERVA